MEDYMIDAREARVISLALSYLLAGTSDIVILHNEYPLHDIDNQPLPTDPEIETLLNKTRKIYSELENDESPK